MRLNNIIDIVVFGGNEWIGEVVFVVFGLLLDFVCVFEFGVI